MRNKTIGLLSMALAGLFFTGCATNGNVSRVNQPDRSLVIVPVKGQPISVRSIHTASVVGLGVIGGQLEQAATTGSSEALCARLNQYTDFNGERILAEECAKLLQVSPKVAFHGVSVHPLDAAMLGVKNMESSEQQRFKVNCPNVSKWNGNFSDWKKGPPVAGSLPAPSQRVVYLEATFNMVILNHHNQIQPASIFLRLMDPETGERLGLGGSWENFDIAEVTGSSDLRTFEADFRKCMNECARKVLRNLNLL